MLGTLLALGKKRFFTVNYKQAFFFITKQRKHFDMPLQKNYVFICPALFSMYNENNKYIYIFKNKNHHNMRCIFRNFEHIRAVFSIKMNSVSTIRVGVSVRRLMIAFIIITSAFIIAV